MTSISPPFPSVVNHRHKFITTNRLKNHRSSSNLFHHSVSRVSDSSLSVCRCSNGFQESVRSVIKWFDEYVIGYKKYDLKDNDHDDWDWERWKKHFVEIDQQERIVSILKSHLNRAILKEDYEDAARIKVAIAAAATNDTVGRVMSYLSRAIEEERYTDAAFVHDYANAGLRREGWVERAMGDQKVKNEAMEIMGLFQVLPRLVVFDLDYTLWPFYCECRSKRETPSMYPHVKGILHALKDKGVDMAIASRSPTKDIAETFIDKLGIKPLFVAQEIFSSWSHKTEHFKKIHDKTRVPYESMLFFDDEDRNIGPVSKLGVTAILVNNGVTLGAFRQGLTQFSQGPSSSKRDKKK